MMGLALSGLLLTGCGGGGKFTANNSGPDWTRKGNGAFIGDKGTIIRGVGLATYDPNKSLQIDSADEKARKSVGAVLSDKVQALFKDYAESHKNYYDPDASGSDEMVKEGIRTLVDVDLKGSQIVDHWTDPQTGDIYALAEFDINNTFYDAYKSLLKNSVRAEHRAEMEKHMDDFTAEMDTAVDKQKQSEAQLLGATQPAPAVTSGSSADTTSPAADSTGK
jgi:ribosomal protein S16